MLRKLLMLALVGLFCGAAAVAAADDEKPDPRGKLAKFAGKIDKAKIFGKLDADGDGKLTKDEFKKFGEHVLEKLKDKGKGGKLPEGVLGDKLFEKMDADKDGKVTKEEFEKADLLGGLAGKKGDDPKPEEKKPDEKKPEEKKG